MPVEPSTADVISIDSDAQISCLRSTLDVPCPVPVVPTALDSTHSMRLCAGLVGTYLPNVYVSFGGVNFFFVGLLNSIQASVSFHRSATSGLHCAFSSLSVRESFWFWEVICFFSAGKALYEKGMMTMSGFRIDCWSW